MASSSTAQGDVESSSDYATSSGSDGKPGISWPIERPAQTGEFTKRLEGEVRRQSDTTAAAVAETTKSTMPFDDFLPGHKRSQSGIAMRSFALGGTLFASILLYAYFAFEKESRLWRPFFFLATLSLFHFLEFWTHARYNLQNATISTFLLFTNGVAYNAAHTTAMLETILTSIYAPKWQDHFDHLWMQLLGLTLVIVGQACRTAAMVTAGTNFHHFVQTKQREGHQLVTRGIYAWLRHPSYFGFFWWAVGTQLVLGNFFCFFLYNIILWRFFYRRIKGKDKLLWLLWKNWRLTKLSGRKAPRQILRRRLRTVPREDDGWHSADLVRLVSRRTVATTTRISNLKSGLTIPMRFHVDGLEANPNDDPIAEAIARLNALSSQNEPLNER
jgi:protein-S-isoprenylcysteine O-methyltransferase